MPPGAQRRSLQLMANDGNSVPYNHDLKPLEEILAGVCRPGDFFVEGSLETPMPRVEVEGVGLLSFPLAQAQVEQLILQAARAPYGRGEETILDESVRKAARVRSGRWRRYCAPQQIARVAPSISGLSTSRNTDPPGYPSPTLRIRIRTTDSR